MNKINRLVVFGDSFTYGHGLSDCRSSDDLPSTQAWPALLGNQLDVPVVNNAIPGYSNIEILISILTFGFAENDLAIVGWTYVARDVLFNAPLFNKQKYKKDGHESLGPSRSNENSKTWLRLHNDYDLSIRAGLLIDHGMLYLNSLNVMNKHFYAVHRSKPRWTGHTPPMWVNAPSKEIHYDLLPKLDKAPDDDHPGPLSQKALANNLYDIIK